MKQLEAPPLPEAPAPKKKSKKGERPPEKLTVTHEEIFQLFLTADPKWNLREFRDWLITPKDEGGGGVEKCSYARIQSWSAKHKWYPRRKQYHSEEAPVQTNERLRAISQIGGHLTDTTMDGLIAKYIDKLDKSLLDCVVSTPDDVVKLLDGFDKLMRVKQQYRGAITPLEPKGDEPEAVAPAPVVEEEPGGLSELGDFSTKVVEGGKGG